LSNANWQLALNEVLGDNIGIRNERCSLVHCVCLSVCVSVCCVCWCACYLSTQCAMLASKQCPELFGSLLFQLIACASHAAYACFFFNTLSQTLLRGILCLWQARYVVKG